MPGRSRRMHQSTQANFAGIPSFRGTWPTSTLRVDRQECENSPVSGTQSSILRHDYFGLNTQMIARDHQFNAALYPVSSNISLEYYRRQKLIVSDKRKIPTLLMEKLSKNEHYITFRLETQDCRVDFSNEILQQTSSFLSKQGISASIALHYNIAQSVYCITVNEGNWHQKLRQGR